MWVREKKGRIERDVRWGGVDLKGKGGGGGGRVEMKKVTVVGVNIMKVWFPRLK